jgi:NitT/TauT family transport system substrate-binding protein
MRFGVRSVLAAVPLTAALCAATATAMDKVSFGLNWIPDTEHGGYYQALADGTYAKYGLDVTIVPGGPQNNNAILLAWGKLDFYMGSNMIEAFSAVQVNVPIIVVAAEYQKDPQILMSHPDVGYDKFTDLSKATAYISKTGLVTYYAWLKSAYGFKDENVKPYTFNSQPFIADKNSIQQGYVNFEPYDVQKRGGFKPNVFLLADQGFSTYATTIETRLETVQKNPDLVQRFVDATSMGWYHFLYSDNSKALALIKQQNPDLTDDQIAYGLASLKENGIVDSGDTLKYGIGAMTDARMKDFFDKMVTAGVFPADFDYKKAYTLKFVDKGVGVELRK